ncbi:unnamed protein product [Ectocarpus sp. 4 AP-2014]
MFDLCTRSWVCCMGICYGVWVHQVTGYQGRAREKQPGNGAGTGFYKKIMVVWMKSLVIVGVTACLEAWPELDISILQQYNPGNSGGDWVRWVACCFELSEV